MIEAAATEHPRMALKGLCELFLVSRSWYYQKPSEEQKARESVALRDAIELIVLEFSGYAYRRVTEALRREGWTINHKKVLRVMRKEALLCQLKRRFKPTTDSLHSLKRYPNLIKDATLSGPDQGWVADITHTSGASHELLLSGSDRGRLLTLLCRLAPLAGD
ncbi:MAG: IS3 family transposase [Actinobacteria bacterium]|nr:IS3 family transposase [Actinomycetota bacterium]